MRLGRRAKTIVVVLLLVTAVALIYGQSLTFQFVNLDDGSYVHHNRYVLKGITIGNVVWAFTHRHAANWHPFTWMSHMLDCQVFGIDPGAHHAVNALLHAVNGALLLILMARLTGRFWPAAVTAAIFVVHPLRVESVAWISERKDVLSGFFFLVTLLAYERYVRRRLPGMFSVVAILFACGLMSKPMVVTLPAILLLLDYWPLDRVRSNRVAEYINIDGPPRDTFLVLVIEKIPLVVLAIVSCFITMWAQHTARELNSKLSIISRLRTAFSAYLTYLVQAFWPTDLCPFYPAATAPSASRTYLAIAVIGAVGIVALLLSKRRPYVITGWLWFLGMLVPVIGIVPVGGQAHADRYTYLPHIGIYLAVAFGLADLLRSRAMPIRAPAAVTAAVVLAILAVGAWRQAAYWITPETLWRHSLAIDDANHLAHSQLGDLYFIDKNFPMARAEFEKALKTGPKNLIARMELGTVLAEQGEFKGAEEQFRQVIAASPNLPNGYALLGKLLREKNDNFGALECLQKALALQPDDEGAHVEIAVVLRRMNRLDEALQHDLIAIKLSDGKSYDAHRNLANLLASVGRRKEAAQQYRIALELSPDDKPSATGLAWILTTSPPSEGGDPREAIRLLEPLCQSEKATYDQFDALAAAYAATGKFDDALQMAARAKKLAQSTGNPALIKEIEFHQKLYAEHKTFAEEPAGSVPPEQK